MVKRINGDLYSDLITSADPRPMACGGYTRLPIDTIYCHHNADTNNERAIKTWLATGSAQTSAHYQINNKQIIGIVGEETPAWHSGVGDENRRSIGIECVNNAGAPDWTISDDSFESYAKLIADIAKRYKLPIDEKHVRPHSDVFATQCPGGIDMVKLRKRANEILKGSTTSKKTEPKVNQIIELSKSSWLYDAQGNQPLTPDGKRDWLACKKGMKVKYIKTVGKCYQVEYYGLTLHLRKENFK